MSYHSTLLNNPVPKRFAYADYLITGKLTPAIERNSATLYNDVELSSRIYCDRDGQKTVWANARLQSVSHYVASSAPPVIETQGDTDLSGIYHDMNLCHSVTVLSHH